MFWNGTPIERKGDSGGDIEGKNFNITPNTRNIFTNKSEKSLKKLSKKDNLTYRQLLKALVYSNYKPKPGEKNQEDTNLIKLFV